MAAALAAMLLGACAPKEAPAPSREIDFKSELSRYGEWIVLRPYGRVWHPHERNVGPIFVPYRTGGHWVPGPKGWEFESEWGWGEFVFHRGRWFQGGDLGWVWLPDQERAASWVEWRVGSDFVGWTPLPPPAPPGAAPQPFERPWSFVKARHFAQKDLGQYLLNQEGVMKALAVTQEPPPQRARLGPEADWVRAAGGLTADGGVPDLTPPPEPAPPPPAVVSDEEKKDEEEEPPPPKKKKKAKKKGKRGR